MLTPPTSRVRLLALPALLLALAGCGSDTADVSAQPADAPPEAAETAPPTESASAPDAPVALPALSPADVSPDTPVAARELRDAVFALIGQTVTVQGTATSAFSPQGPALRVASEPADPDAPFVLCVFPAGAEGSLPSGDVTLRGTVGPPNLAGQKKLTMSDCAAVEAGSEATTVTALADAIIGWIGAEVAVTGRYNGEATSQLPDGPRTVVRVQDAGTEGLAEQVVGCALPTGESVPGAASADREGVVFQGTISDQQNWTSDTLALDECTIVNR